MREAAAKALDEHTGAGVVGALVDALEDPVAAVRLSAAETLAEKKDAASAALLIARVDHPAPFVRAAALRAVRELVTPDALPAAVRALSDESPEVRREAVSVLGYLKADQALPALMAVAGDADPAVRRAVMSALVFTRPGGPGVGALLAGLDDAALAGARAGGRVDRQGAHHRGDRPADHLHERRELAGARQGRERARADLRRCRQYRCWARRSRMTSATCARRLRPRSAKSPARPRWSFSSRPPAIPTPTCASSCAGPSADARRRCSFDGHRSRRRRTAFHGGGGRHDFLGVPATMFPSRRSQREEIRRCINNLEFGLELAQLMLLRQRRQMGAPDGRPARACRARSFGRAAEVGVVARQEGCSNSPSGREPSAGRRTFTLACLADAA